jgi:hypothetical protein
MTEADWPGNKQSLIVRPTMSYHITHTLQLAAVYLATRT